MNVAAYLIQGTKQQIIVKLYSQETKFYIFGMLSRIAFYPTLVYNVLLEKCTAREWYNRIDDTVILGALPFRSMLPQLKAENVKGVVSLNEEFELQHFVPTSEEWQNHGIEQLKLETVDLTAAPSQSNLTRGTQFIHMFQQQGSSVYVHCKAGRTRSTTLVACYLMSRHGWHAEHAIQYIKTKRPHIWLRTTQLDAVHLFYKNNILPPKS